MSTVCERYSFNASVSRIEGRVYTTYLEDRFDKKHDEGIASFTAENHRFSKEMSKILDFVVAWVEENFEVSLGDRIPGLSDVLIYTPEEFGQIRNKLGCSPETAAFSLRLGRQIHLCDTGSRHELLHSMVHELVHLLCFSRIMVWHQGKEGDSSLLKRKIKSVVDCQSGLRLWDDRFKALNEVVTELMTNEIILQLQLQNDEAAYDLRQAEIGYERAVVVLGLFLKKLAQKEGISFKDMRLQLYRAAVMGDVSILRLINSHYGSRFLRQIMDFPEHPSNNYALRFLREIGIFSSELYNDLLLGIRAGKVVDRLEAAKIYPDWRAKRK